MPTPSPNTKALRPTRILFPKEYWSDHEDIQTLAQDWVDSLADWLGADKIEMSIESHWKETKPEEIGKGLYETFNNSFIDLTFHGFWTYLADFRREYGERFNANPYVCKVNQYAWDKGRVIPETRVQKALDEVSLHNSWFLNHVLNDDATILVAPRYRLDFRDEYLSVPEYRVFDGWDSNYHAYLSGVPNIVVPSTIIYIHINSN
ncbi:hypothetical protein OQA88_7472 [Cercophora sp. LCS_1]